MRVAICDDEPVFRAELHEWLRQYKTEKRICMDITEYADGTQLLCEREPFDVVFMDYRMPHLNGLDTCRTLRARNALCSIIFVTAYAEQFIFDAFEVQPFRFMAKPLQKENVFKALDSYIQQQKHFYPLVIIEDGEQKTVDTQNILYLEGDGKYCFVHTTTETVHSSKTLAQVHKLLPAHCFYRIHKSYVINLYCVLSFKDNVVALNSGDTAIVGRNRIAEFKRVYMNFVKNFYVRM